MTPRLLQRFDTRSATRRALALMNPECPIEQSLRGVDDDAQRIEALVELPGFTRGLDFHGRFAFVGLSQVRESAVFSGIPITERDQPRQLVGAGG